MSEELKPCPFCGGKAEAYTEDGGWDCRGENVYHSGIVCTKCGVSVELEHHGDDLMREDDDRQDGMHCHALEEMAVERWNRRAGEAKVVAQVSLDEDKLRQLVDEATKDVAAEYAQPVKDALKALEYYGERGEPMPAYVCRELADDMKAAGDD